MTRFATTTIHTGTKDAVIAEVDRAATELLLPLVKAVVAFLHVAEVEEAVVLAAVMEIPKPSLSSLHSSD